MPDEKPIQMKLYNKYRPVMFNHLRGVARDHGEALRRRLEQSQITTDSYLFHGASGTGKTTLARIFARAINCQNPNNGEPCMKCTSCMSDPTPGYEEIDAGKNRGIDVVREKISLMSLIPPMGAKRWVYVWDEGHSLTNDAMQALLKPTEDGLTDTINIICTTEPNKIASTLRSRLISFKFDPFKHSELVQLLVDVTAWEGVQQYDLDVIKSIASLASGSPRVALTELEKVLGMGWINDAGKSSSIIAQAEQIPQDILALARLLSKASDLKETRDVLREAMKAHDAEDIRRTICGYYRSILMSNSNTDIWYIGVIHMMMEGFLDPFFESSSAKNKLVHAVMHAWFLADSKLRKKNDKPNG